MDKISKMFDGKKTQMVGVGLAALGVAVGFGWVELSTEQMTGIVAVLLGAGKIALRLAVAKLEKKVAEVKAPA